MLTSLLENRKYNFLFLFFFLFILCLNSGASNLFNGLPWTNKYETIIILIVLPIILFLKFDILEKTFFRIIIILLLIVKLILIYAPQTGIGHKIYNISNESNQNLFIKTYSNFWQKKYSDIQDFDWVAKENFPLDWVNFDGNINSTMSDVALNNENYKNLNLISEVEFFLFVPEKSKIRIIAKGATNKSNIFFLKDNSNEKFFLELDQENNFLYGDNESYFERGIYHFVGDINYQANKWSFIPQILKNDKFESALNNRIIFLDDDIPDISSLSFFILFGKLYDILIFFFIGSSVIYLIIKSVQKNLINNEFFGMIIFFFLFLFSNIILNYLQLYHGLWPLCLTFILFTIILSYDYFFQKISLLNELYKNPIKYLIFISAPTFFYLGVMHYYHDLQNTSFWTLGDDWQQFQKYSREIVVDGNWIEAGETTFYFRPGIRYIFAIFHILFGQSAFSIKIAEFWTIFLSSLLVVSFLRKLNISIYLSVLAGLTLLIFFLGESFRWIIGRGLSEFYGMIFILFSSYIFLNNNLKNYYQIFLLGIIGIIAAWIREEKIVAILPLIFLANIDRENIGNFWFFLLSFIKKKYKQIIFYWVIVLIGFPTLFELRNYLVSGNFTIITHPNLLANSDTFVFSIHSFYEMVTATPFHRLPRLTPILLIPPLLLSTLILVFPNIYRNFPYPGLAIIILAIVLPTLPLHMSAYIPRHSIYLLPYGIIFSFIIVEKLFGNKINSLAKRSIL